jgi:hypothetical protein
MRGIAVALGLAGGAGYAGCVRPPPDVAAPVTYPSLDPDRSLDPNPMDLADLRSIAAAASIALEIGPAPILRTHSCDAKVSGAAPGHAARCYRCTLAVFDPTPSEAAHPLEPALRTLATTLLAYPHSFLRAARVERIALCRKLAPESAESAESPEAAGAPSAPAGTDAPAEYHVAGLAESAGRRLMVSLERQDASRPDATLHHEIFHLFDHATAAGRDHRRDPEWERLNPPGFRYGDPAATFAITAGFVNDYAKTNAAEDKASVFEYLMSYADELCARAVDDPLLLAKARLVLSRVEAAVPPGLGEFARRRAPCLAPPGGQPPGLTATGS